MTEVIVTGDDDDGDLGDEAERDAFVAAGAAGAHEENAEHHAAAATDAALAASSAASVGAEAAAAAAEAADTADQAASAMGQLISAHMQAMQEHTAVLTGVLAEIQQSREKATPPAPAEPVTQTPDREPKSGKKKFRETYFGGR